MPAVNYVVYGCSSLRTTPRVVTIQELHTGGKTLLQLLLKIGDYLGLYKKLANNSLLIILCTLTTLKLPVKSYPSSR